MVGIVYIIFLLSCYASAIAYGMHPRLSRDQSRLAMVMGGNKHIQLWDLQKNNLRHQFKYQTDITALNTYQCSQEGQVIVGLKNGSVQAYDITLDDHSVLMWNAQHIQSIYSITFNHDETRLLTSSGDGTVGLWRQLTNREQIDMTGDACFLSKRLLTLKHSLPVASAELNNDEGRIASRVIDEAVFFWDTQTEKQQQELKDASRNGIFRFSKDGRCFFTEMRVLNRSVIYVWDMYTYEKIDEFFYEDALIKSFYLSYDEKHIIVLFSQKVVFTDRALKEDIKCIDDVRCVAIAVTQEGTKLIIAKPDGDGFDMLLIPNDFA